ncbi:hypothetical protein AX14_001265 [Amanita brunnescens Koide BX004]|nr:hypothetical protein AX14_001265 [Amanita brunnescens Koide BX004]
MSSTKSGISRYFTPPSSSFGAFESALSSPCVSSTALHEEYPDQRRRRRGSNVSASSRSTDTVTPSLFIRENVESRARTSIDYDNHLNTSTRSLPFYRGPALFFTSAKTGEGANGVFEYIAHRVTRMSEYEEQNEARRLHVREGSTADTIYLQSSSLGKNSGIYKRNCCST